MDPKPRPNRQLYREALRNMTPEQKLLKVFDLSDFSKQLFKAGLRERFPEKTDEELQQLFLKRLKTCHNRNY